jgi:hypothetical protein
MTTVNREIGQYPISIGTSLALEGLFGIHPNQPKHQPVASKFTHLWINIETLVRNLYASCSKEMLATITVDQAFEWIMDELYQIQEVVKEHPRSDIAPIFYYDIKDELRWVYPKARWREPTTERQQYLANIETLTCDAVIRGIEDNQYPITYIKGKPDKQAINVALLTHSSHQLLWRFKFNHLVLLESHTGKLKSPGDWSSKLKGISGDDHLPFTPFTLQVFGDGNLFSGEDTAIRREVKQIATTSRWTKITTTDKIKTDIANKGSPQLKEIYNKLMTRQ